MQKHHQHVRGCLFLESADHRSGFVAQHVAPNPSPTISLLATLSTHAPRIQKILLASLQVKDFKAHVWCRASSPTSGVPTVPLVYTTSRLRVTRIRTRQILM